MYSLYPNIGEIKSYSEEDIENTKNNIGKLVKLILFVVVTVLLTLCLSRFVILNIIVPTNSMESTIMVGDRLIGNRMAYMFSKPKRGEIIIFKYPDDPDIQYIKRVIGLPGDTVHILEGKVFINNQLLNEEYIGCELLGDYGPYKVPENSYFVLGDNRNVSKDSRCWKNTYVHESQVLAKAEVKYWPVIGRVK